MRVQCARCRFDASAWEAAPTYAFATYLGLDLRQTQREADEWATTHLETGATAYCAACRRVCWLARSECAQQALQQHTALLRSLEATRRHTAETA